MKSERNRFYDGVKAHRQDQRRRLAEWNRELFEKQPGEVQDLFTYFPANHCYSSNIGGKRPMFFASTNRWKHLEVWYRGDMNAFVKFVLHRRAKVGGT